MDTDVGEVFEPGATAYIYKPSFHEVEEERVDLVVLTVEGDLIEYCGRERLSRCSLSQASKGNVDLKPFYTYEPHFKYYLVHNRHRLYIVKRVDRCTLKLEKTLENVSHFSIEDRNNLGDPQFLVWYTGYNTPSIESVFSKFIDQAQVTRFKIIPNSMLKINALSKTLDSRIKETEKVIFDKTMLAYRMCSRNTFRHQENLPAAWNRGNTLFKVLGDEKPNLKLSPKVSPISHGEPWLRVLPDAIVVGLYVCNLKECEIGTLALTALDPSMQFLKNVVFRTSRGFNLAGELADYCPCRFLAGRTQGCVIGVMKEPIFIQETLLIELVLSFSIGNNKRMEQIYVGNIHVAHENVVSCYHLPFINTKQVADLLVLIAVSSQADIVYRVGETSPHSLKSVLLEMGFSQVSQQFFIHSFNRNSVFSGMVLLVIRKETHSSIRIYYRKRQQLLSFIVSLKNKLVSCGQIEERLVEPATIVCSHLNEEIKALYKYFSSNSLDSVSEIEREIYLDVDMQFLTELLSLETVTETNIPLLHQFEDNISTK